VPSGLFVPSLLTGAAFGRFVGEVVHRGCYSMTTPMRPWADVGIYSLVGAVAQLSGTARITISLATILMEATGDAAFSLPIFLTVMVAKWTGAGMNCVTGKGIYDMHIMELKHVPLLETMPEREMVSMEVRHVMARNVKCLEAVETVGRIIDLLETCFHNGFPVVYPGTKRLAGLMRRGVLHRVLEQGGSHGIFQPPGAELRSLPAIRWEDVMLVPHKSTTFGQLRGLLDPEYLEHRVDLRPYINRNGYSMPKHASVASCYMLFRQLGLRHLPIVAPGGEICGIITRKDLILIEQEHEHGSKGCCDPEDSEQDSSDDDSELPSQRLNHSRRTLGADNSSDGQFSDDDSSVEESSEDARSRRPVRVSESNEYLTGAGM